MIIGFDVDGIIAKAPLRVDKLLRYWGRGWNRLLSTSIGKLLYRQLRCVDTSTKKVVCRLRAEGYQIVIATYVLEKHRGEVEGWLTKNQVPFDRLVLAKEMETSLSFKVRVIKEERCEYFVEDQDQLALALRVSEGRIIHYRRKEDLGGLLEQN